MLVERSNNIQCSDIKSEYLPKTSFRKRPYVSHFVSGTLNTKKIGTKTELELSLHYVKNTYQRRPLKRFSSKTDGKQKSICSLPSICILWQNLLD